MNCLQQLVLPGLDFNAPDNMYVRSERDGVMLNRQCRCVQFFQGSKFSLDTYFNGLTVDLWRQSCQVDTVSLHLEGRGRVQMRLELHRLGCAKTILDEQELALDSESPSKVPVKAWPNLSSGMLYVTVFALSDGEITGGSWVTADEPVRSVDLAVVVTHFNRQEYVLPAMRRLHSGLTGEVGQHVNIFVVDNSRNLGMEQLSGVTVIPNRNLGGSGGFTRGLMEATDRNFTHCLFMDDDVSCEVESVRRAYTVLAYAKNGSLAVAGSLLRDMEPYRLFEKGACFDGLCRPLKSGLDMQDVDDLLRAEERDQCPDYGGWWFFAFKISKAQHLAFPFFVRGDDVMFCMINDFDIVTANGIACWGDDFGLKAGPLPVYLDVRNHLVQKLSHMDSGVLSTFLLATRSFVHASFSYNYATARAVSEAICDVTRGGQFWRENLDMTAVRERIFALQPDETMAPVDLAIIAPVVVPMEEGLLRKLFRFGSLNGYLLPDFLMKDETVLQEKSFRGTLRQLFRHKRVLYYYEPFKTGYVAEYDRARFFREVICFLKSLCSFAIKYRRLRVEYRKSMHAMTTREFWDQVYSDDPPI